MPLWKRRWDELSPSKLRSREKALQVITMMRGGKSLAESAKQVGIDSRTVQRHLGNAIVKTARGYIAKARDKISREMFIKAKEMDGDVPIVIKDSRIASIIGRYNNAVRRLLHNADAASLKEFEGVRIKDASGLSFVFETNAERILEMEKRKEEAEFFSIYKV